MTHLRTYGRVTLNPGQLLKAHVPLALIAGLVVALPTIPAESPAGRAAGVIGGVGVLTLIAWSVTRRARQPVSFSSLDERHSVTVELGTATAYSVDDGGVAAARVMREFARLRWITRLWPVITAIGLIVGGLLGVWAGSFVLIVLFAALGLLLASLIHLALAMRGMHQLSALRPPRD